MPARKKAMSRKPKSPAKKFWKGDVSKTRPGRLDFVTHKGDKWYHRAGHLEASPEGTSARRKPYARAMQAY